MTKIPYVDETWNPNAGCTKVSVECLNCYAERMAFRQSCMEAEKNCHRTEDKFVEKYQSVVYVNGGWNGKVYCDKKALDIPLHWLKPRRIFVNSMSDTFHEKVPFEFIDKIFAVMALCPQHTFQVLTKRPKRMLEYLTWRTEPDIIGRTDRSIKIDGSGHRGEHICGFMNQRSLPLPNVHLGTSCGNQEMADLRIPPLLQCPAAVRFISAEPLLGDINFGVSLLQLGSLNWDPENPVYEQPTNIDQVIIGAESLGGHPGRVCKIEWFRNIVQQCKAAGVAVFVKQIHMWQRKGGTKLFETISGGMAEYKLKVPSKYFKRVLLKYPRDKDLFPKDLRCWEYPESEVK